MQNDVIGAAGAMREWLKRAAALVPARDRIELLSPPFLVEKFVLYAMTRHKRDLPSDDPTQRDPEFVRLLLDFFRMIGRHYFRLEIRGVENVPSAGPVLLVGNHNGGLLPADAFFTALAIWDHFGPARAVYALAHDFLFHDPTLRLYALKLGMLRAGHASARQVLARGGMVLVYPGSDLDAFRPWGARGRVVLGGRTGFLKLAVGAGVPIVPVVSTGTHEQFVVLTRGDRLARLLQMPRWARTVVCPIVLAVPWGIASGFVPYLPLPSQTTVAFGEPVTWPALAPRDAENAAALARCYAEVEAKMQSMLDELTEGRRPFVGQRRGPRALPIRIRNYRGPDGG